MPSILPPNCKRPVFLLSLLGLFLTATLADEPSQLSESQRKDRLRKIRKIVEPFDVKVSSDKEPKRSRLMDEPSLLYADNARELSDSSLWIWELAGRPISATAVEFNRKPDALFWTFEFVSFTPAGLQVSLAPDRPWSTKPEPGMLRPVPDAPAVAETRPLRALQMKRLAERFAAIETHRSQGRIELRRLSTPVYRQAESATGDGAIFVFAHGTNPEILLSIGTSATSPAAWNYAIGALSAEELFVTVDGQEVWRENLFTKPGARSNYINGRLTSTVE